MALPILGRILLILPILVVSFLSAAPFEYFNDTILGYQTPPGFFGFTIIDGILAWTLSFIFWSGILFGILGKKIDYVPIVLIIALALWMYSGTDNVTPQMYLGLLGVALLGNAIGYILKLARLRWLSK